MLSKAQTHTNDSRRDTKSQGARGFLALIVPERFDRHDTVFGNKGWKRGKTERIQALGMASGTLWRAGNDRRCHQYIRRSTEGFSVSSKLTRGEGRVVNWLKQIVPVVEVIWLSIWQRYTRKASVDVLSLVQDTKVVYRRRR